MVVLLVNNMKAEKQAGQTIIEVLVALSTVVVIVSAITIAVLSSLNNAQFSKNQNSATQYAQEGMEIMRKVRDTDYQAFYDLAESYYCLPQGATVPTNPPVGFDQCDQNIDVYIREVEVLRGSLSAPCVASTPPPLPTPTPRSDDSIKVIVRVKWSDSRCTGESFCHKAELASCFTNLRGVPIP